MRVLITGSRDWPDDHAVRSVLDELYAEYGDRLVVVHGACPTGADAVADQWATTNGVTVERYPVDWSEHGKAAGPVRNAQMVATRPDACIAFIHRFSKGAQGCLDLAVEAGIAWVAFRTGGVPEHGQLGNQVPQVTERPDPGFGFRLVTCAGCPRQVLLRSATPVEARCDVCWRVFRDAPLSYYGTDPGGLGMKIRHAPGLSGDVDIEAHRNWVAPPKVPVKAKRKGGTS